MDQTDLLWALLTAERSEAIKKLNPECIDFSRRRKDRRTLLVCAAELLLSSSDLDGVWLDCIGRLISWGASPFQKCMEFAPCFNLWKTRDEEGTKILVKPAEFSAISYVEMWIEQCKGTPPWAKE